jgi:hypothetical protein
LFIYEHKARRAMHPSWVVEDAIVRSVRGKRKRRGQQSQQRLGTSRQARPTAQPVALYTAEIRDTDSGLTWRCTHDHGTRESANRCADAMEERINRLGWEQATEGQ